MRVSSRYFDAANIDPRLRAGLVGHWIGGGSGLTWMDRSGYQNHGTLTSGPTWGLGFGGKRDALFFDGVDDYVNAGSMAMLDAAPAATLAYWGYRSATNKTITINKHINNNNWLELSHRSDGNIYGITANGGVYYKVIGLSVTGWHHYCLVFDGGLVGNARVALYVDGSALAGGSVAGPLPATLGTGGTMRLGAQNGLGAYGECGLDDVRAYLRALSPAEVALLASPSFSPVIPRIGLGF